MCNCEVRLCELCVLVFGSGFLRCWFVYELIDFDKFVRNVIWLVMYRVSYIFQIVFGCWYWGSGGNDGFGRKDVFFRCKGIFFRC